MSKLWCKSCRKVLYMQLAKATRAAKQWEPQLMNVYYCPVNLGLHIGHSYET